MINFGIAGFNSNKYQNDQTLSFKRKINLDQKYIDTNLSDLIDFSLKFASDKVPEKSPFGKLNKKQIKKLYRTGIAELLGMPRASWKTIEKVGMSMYNGFKISDMNLNAVIKTFNSFLNTPPKSRFSMQQNLLKESAKNLGLDANAGFNEIRRKTRADLLKQYGIPENITLRQIYDDPQQFKATIPLHQPEIDIKSFEGIGNKIKESKILENPPAFHSNEMPQLIKKLARMVRNGIKEMKFD